MSNRPFPIAYKAGPQIRVLWMAGTRVAVGQIAMRVWHVTPNSVKSALAVLHKNSHENKTGLVTRPLERGQTLEGVDAALYCFCEVDKITEVLGELAAIIRKATDQSWDGAPIQRLERFIKSDAWAEMSEACEAAADRNAIEGTTRTIERLANSVRADKLLPNRVKRRRPDLEGVLEALDEWNAKT